MAVATETQAKQKVGKVVQVIGPVVDIEYEGGLPEIYNAVRIETQSDGKSVRLTGEIASHLGGGRVARGPGLGRPPGAFANQYLPTPTRRA